MTRFEFISHHTKTLNEMARAVSKRSNGRYPVKGLLAAGFDALVALDGSESEHQVLSRIRAAFYEYAVWQNEKAAKQAEVTA